MSDRRSATRRESERVPPEPDLHDDLGYELCDLESYETDEGRILVLPKSSPRIRGPSAAGRNGSDALQEVTAGGLSR